MPSLTLHARIEICLLFALSLGSCGSSSADNSDHQFNDIERDEIAELSTDVAFDVMAEDQRLQDLENRVADLESQSPLLKPLTPRRNSTPAAHCSDQR